MLLTLFLCTSLFAKQHIKVSAFYLHPTELEKRDTLPADYTMHMVQLRMEHSFDTPMSMAELCFPETGNGPLAGDIGISYPNMRVLTDNGWQAALPTDFGMEENRNRLITKIAYSYMPIIDGALSLDALRNKNHYASAIYTQSTKSNWYAQTKHLTDSIDFFFDIDPSLFFVRTSRNSVADDMGKLHYTLQPAENPLEFYVFYRLEYENFQTTLADGKISLDFLFENVDDSRCTLTDSTYHVALYPNDSVARSRMARLEQTYRAIIDLVGEESEFPHDVTIVLSSQTVHMMFNGPKVMFGMAMRKNGEPYAAILLDHSMFYSKTLPHEIIHTCFPDFECHGFEGVFFKESIVDYVASWLSLNRLGEDSVFVKHQAEVAKKMVSTKQTRQLVAATNGDIIISGNDEGLDNNWVFYDFFPLQLHTYALRYDETTFVSDVVAYMKANPGGKPTFRTFTAYMKGKGYKDIEKIWKPFI